MKKLNKLVKLLRNNLDWCDCTITTKPDGKNHKYIIFTFGYEKIEILINTVNNEIIWLDMSVSFVVFYDLLRTLKQWKKEA